MEHILVMPNVSRPCEIMFEAHLLLWRPHIFKLKMSFLGLIRGFYIEGTLYGWLSISRIKVHLRPASSTAYGHQPHWMDKDQCLCLVRQCLLLNALAYIMAHTHTLFFPLALSLSAIQSVKQFLIIANIITRVIPIMMYANLRCNSSIHVLLAMVAPRQFVKSSSTKQKTL